MFEKWDLPKNLCELFVIDRSNLDLFVGRKSKVEKLIPLLQGNNVALVEGVFGCGKTSFGNYCRFKTNQFTPTEEIKTDPNFTLDSFLQCLISTILQEIHLKKSPYSSLINSKELEIQIVWNLAGGYQDNIENVLKIHLNTLDAYFKIYDK